MAFLDLSPEVRIIVYANLLENNVVVLQHSEHIGCPLINCVDCRKDQHLFPTWYCFHQYEPCAQFRIERQPEDPQLPQFLDRGFPNERIINGLALTCKTIRREIIHEMVSTESVEFGIATERHPQTESENTMGWLNKVNLAHAKSFLDSLHSDTRNRFFDTSLNLRIMGCYSGRPLDISNARFPRQILPVGLPEWLHMCLPSVHKIKIWYSVGELKCPLIIGHAGLTDMSRDDWPKSAEPPQTFWLSWLNRFFEARTESEFYAFQQDLILEYQTLWNTQIMQKRGSLIQPKDIQWRLVVAGSRLTPDATQRSEDERRWYMKVWMTFKRIDRTGASTS
ncbi:hypothetical protein EV356DRAFT_551225 [Viridothelium virens]|uniref:Uncharacterized protein n=1 Tax=Viridothelium virens TaxID=1048519 RepID=A0A6A6H1S0_VIRVR|nr:hypothetical protein EV356DRAFT_551225 [Viridothelium virens]